MSRIYTIVTPAQAGAQCVLLCARCSNWVPAYAGMTWKAPSEPFVVRRGRNRRLRTRLEPQRFSQSFETVLQPAASAPPQDERGKGKPLFVTLNLFQGPLRLKDRCGLLA